MGVLDFFQVNRQGSSGATNPQGNANQGGNNAPQGNNGPQGNNQNQGNNQGGGTPNPVTNNPETMPNPLDAYAKMWDTANKQTEAAPEFNLDPKVLGDVTGSMNFLDGIPQELQQRATSGDSAALMEMMNLVGRNTYKMALQHTSSLTGKFVDARSQYDSKRIPGNVRNELTQNALSSTPNYQHPVVRQQLKDVAERLQSQNPEASPQQIADMAKKYLSDLVSAINPQSGQQNDANGNPAQQSQGPTDWDKWLGV
jgi:hypothetical protein